MYPDRRKADSGKELFNLCLGAVTECRRYLPPPKPLLWIPEEILKEKGHLEVTFPA